MTRKPPKEIAVPTHGGEYEQRPDGSIEPTPLEQERRAEAEQLEAKARKARADATGPRAAAEATPTPIGEE